MPAVTFWFDFASTYSWLSAMRLEEEAEARGVETVWKPFLLGPIFKRQGWDSSPFVLQPAKGRYMVRDVERLAAARGLAFVGGEALIAGGFPRMSLHAARLAIAGLETTEEGRALTKAIFAAEFGEGRDIGDKAVLTEIVSEAGAPDRLLTEMASEDVRTRLRTNTEDAMSRGRFGAPSFVVEEELFWGDDRLEAALDWAARTGDLGTDDREEEAA
ncbi:MAG: 2-hydroxychromene-2-carboxylate isomerase [Pseudomonadota bacterium]